MAVRLGLDAKLFYTEWLDSTTLVKKTNDPTPTVPASFPSSGTPLDAANSSDPQAELDTIKDVTFTIEKTTADITTRAASGWRIEVPVLKTASIDFQIIWDSADPAFSNVQYCFFNDQPLYLCIMDGDLNDSSTADLRLQGLYAPFGVNSFTRTEGLEDAITASVTLTPTWVSTSYPPTWIDVTRNAS